MGECELGVAFSAYLLEIWVLFQKYTRLSAKDILWFTKHIVHIQHCSIASPLQITHLWDIHFIKRSRGDILGDLFQDTSFYFRSRAQGRLG